MPLLKLHRVWFFIMLTIGVLQGEAKEVNPVQFKENKGQLPAHVAYHLQLKSGDIYFEQGVLTYNLYESGVVSDVHLGKIKPEDAVIKGHAYKVKFQGANLNSSIVSEKKSKNYYNYFIGNDESRWGRKVHEYEKLTYQEIYPGIDLQFYGHYQQLKYDFIVQPNADPSLIHLNYEGVDNLKLKKGHLFIKSNAGLIVEQSPYAYQEINGEKQKVDCNYQLENGVLSYEFPNGYDQNLPLVIDPVLTFGTYTGSTASNFGCTATYDDVGNMYVGGTVFGIGYPTSTGAFQTTMNGGNIDMAISKFSADGTSLLYSTYIGGSDNEIPHSLVVNSLNQLCILGTTGSADYPVTPGAYRTTFGAGPALSMGGGYGFDYLLGCDMVVAKLSDNGSSLLSATFMGGTDNDGINRGSILHYNYGDAFRGEIIVDAADNILVASTTNSSDFPISASAPQSTHGGLLDGCVFKLNSSLSTLMFSTFLGGSDYDCAYSVQLSPAGNVMVAGGTVSGDFPTTPGAVNSGFMGGTADGFVAQLNSTGSNLNSSSYVGTAGYDQCFFVQTDLSNDVFVVGQTDGSYPVSAGVYANNNSGQFIHKFNDALNTSILSTTVGTGSGNVDIAISAFLVSDCGQIFISGWGGTLNGATAYDAHATFSTTNGLPTAGGPFQATTDGSDFYLMVLAPDAQSLLYATFFGGGVSAEHVDGGTSRFDKNGTVYQAVCAGCGGNSDFPTTPGAWSNTNNSTNCNLGAFKFDLGSITPVITIPQPYVCLPSSYQFSNNSSGGNWYEWDFGDGNTSNDMAPAHTYADTGHYQVSLIVVDTTGCLAPDTAYLEIDVYAVDNAVIAQIDTICPGDSVQLNASGGTTYEWTPATFLSDPNIANPIASPPFTASYQVVATDACGSDTADVTIYVHNEQISTMPDTTICAGNIITLEAYGGIDYQWYPSTAMINPNSPTPNVAPLSSIQYYVDVTTANGCILTDSVYVTTVNNVPQPVVSNDTTICVGDSIQLTAIGGTSQTWYPVNLVSNTNGNSVMVSPPSDATIYIDFTNACGTITDSIQVGVIQVNPIASPDTTICPGDTAFIWASGGVGYQWTPSSWLSHPDSSNTMAYPANSTTYTVEVTNNIGCSESLDVTVNLYPEPVANAGADLFIEFGDEVTINAYAGGDFYWTTQDTMSCYDCLNPIVSPTETSTYYLYVTDQNGCQNSDTVTVFLDGVLYVPNTFTPNGDGLNDFFTIKGKEIEKFELWVFNRWGELIFTTTDMNDQWDGTYGGLPVQIDTYVWKIQYSDYHNDYGELIGHVNVLR